MIGPSRLGIARQDDATAGWQDRRRIGAGRRRGCGEPHALGGGVNLDGRLAELIPGTPRTELQRMVLEHDWAATPLGAEEHLVAHVAHRRQHGAELPLRRCCSCGARSWSWSTTTPTPRCSGNRHPSALGKRVPDVWVDVWADIKAMIDEVFAGGATYFEDLPLTMTRHGFAEECYFTFSYSPVVEPGGAVAGLLNTVVETTQRVLATRRLGVLQQLGSLPRSVHGNTAEAVRGGPARCSPTRAPTARSGSSTWSDDERLSARLVAAPRHRRRGRARRQRHPGAGAGGDRRPADVRP